jgi:hypothetical protein
MKSVRFEKELEERLRQVAKLTRQSESEIIRSAVRAHCEKVLGDRLDRRLADFVGSVASGGGSSRHRPGIHANPQVPSEEEGTTPIDRSIQCAVARRLKS